MSRLALSLRSLLLKTASRARALLMVELTHHGRCPATFSGREPPDHAV